jgi:phage/plasmid-like protein (TIGR03299 family)
MSHDLEILDGRASMVYNKTFGDPWHTLGTPVGRNLTIKEALEICRGNYTVTTQPLTAMVPNTLFNPFAEPGDEEEFESDLVPVPFGGKVATVRIIPGTDRLQVLGVVGKTYGVVQNETVMEKAYAVVGADPTEGAYVDTAGVLLDGTRFFSYIRLDDLVIDPVGINDVIERGLAIYTSHDGTVSVSYAFTDIRAVCRNTITFGIEGAKRVFKAKHTSGVHDAMDEAQAVLGVSTQWAKAFEKQAERLLSISFNQDRWDKVLNTVFPTPPSPTKQQENTAARTRDKVRGIFEGPRNAENFGRNGWTMYNAIGEYLDHGRGGNDEKRAIASMTPGSWVEKRKAKAADAILASA